MASTYSNLKIQLMATGENSGTWGNVTNANLGDAIEQAIVETATVTFASNNVTLTLSDSNSRQDARALRLNLTVRRQVQGILSSQPFKNLTSSTTARLTPLR
jgi:hypothetical protein